MAKRSKKGNLFDQTEVLKLCEWWIEQNEYVEMQPPDDELSAYHNGIAQGVKFVVMLLKRTGD